MSGLHLCANLVGDGSRRYHCGVQLPAGFRICMGYDNGSEAERRDAFFQLRAEHLRPAYGLGTDRGIRVGDANDYGLPSSFRSGRVGKGGLRVHFDLPCSGNAPSVSVRKSEIPLPSRHLFKATIASPDCSTTTGIWSGDSGLQAWDAIPLRSVALQRVSTAAWF